MPVGTPHLHVEGGERRATIARHQPAGGKPRGGVASRLVHHQPDKRLRAGHKDPARHRGVTAVERWWMPALMSALMHTFCMTVTTAAGRRIWRRGCGVVRRHKLGSGSAHADRCDGVRK